MAVTGAIRRSASNDLGPPNVASMDDVIDTRQASFRLGPQQAVGVRNDSNPEHYFPSLARAIAKRRSRSST
ncbi:hypothetical protein [Bradyrhizobium sp. WSM1253]|uniref:hypothetical protein n=1 Tax=Bradyrhizobium sp. WSM1253 TaxID=319003 RepID=UPI0002F90F79|nr:hypothetical protein [Bradyrhizobium sp. WSM1253]